MNTQLTEMIWLNQSSRTFRYNHIVTIYLINKNESDGRYVHIPEPLITITIYKQLQPNPISY